MSIARAPLGPRLLSRSLASIRCAYSTTNTSTETKGSTRQKPRTQNSPRRESSGENGPINPSKAARSSPSQPARNSPDKNQKPHRTNHKQTRGLKMFIPPGARKFIINGKLETTPDVWAFLQETKIQYDNSKMRPIRLEGDHRHIHKTFACAISFSDQHILHPYHLPYLQPRGHPFIEGIKTRYKEKLETQPLWVYFLAQDDQTGLVRTLGQRRLAREFWVALEEQMNPNSKPKGTVIVTIFDSRKAASAPAVQFGKALADVVMKQQKKKT